MGDTHEVRLADGRRVTYADHGDPDGPVILFCVGTPETRLVPLGEPERAATMGFRLLVPDRPGFGGSDPQPGRVLEDWPADAAGLMDALGVERFARARCLRRRPVRGGVRSATGRPGHRGCAGRPGRAGGRAGAWVRALPGPGGATGAGRDDRPAGPGDPDGLEAFFAPDLSETDREQDAADGPGAAAGGLENLREAFRQGADAYVEDHTINGSAGAACCPG